MEKVKAFVINNIASWVIEIVILGIVATVTISEVRQTNEQTRQMLSAISEFAGERKEAVGGAIDSIANEARNIQVDGKVDVTEISDAASGYVSDFFSKDEKEEEDND